jgi:hypothetical protein
MTAPLPGDSRAIEESSSVRKVIVELARHEGRDEELYDACAVLGRLLAECGGSPTLCALTLDHAAQALGALESPWLVAARAALVEGYTRALQERARLAGLAAWDFPACVDRGRPPVGRRGVHRHLGRSNGQRRRAGWLPSRARLGPRALPPCPVGGPRRGGHPLRGAFGPRRAVA